MGEVSRWTIYVPSFSGFGAIVGTDRQTDRQNHTQTRMIALLTGLPYSYSPSRLAWSEGRRPIGAALHSSNEPSELSQ